MQSSFRRLRRYTRTHGTRRTAVEISRRLGALAYGEERGIVIVKDLDSIVGGSQDETLRVEDLGSEHLVDLARLNRARERPEVDRRFARYVQQGFHGFAAYRAEELIGYYWWVDRDVPTLYPDLRKLGLGIELGEGDVYGSDFFLLEEHRGGGVAGEFLFKVESSLRGRGYARLWGHVLTSNRPARWIYSTRGYKPMWIVSRRRIAFVKRISREQT